MLFSQKLAFPFEKEIIPNGCLLYELEQREQNTQKKKKKPKKKTKNKTKKKKTKKQLSNSPRVPPAGPLGAPTFPPETIQILASPEINREREGGGKGPET